ncbi:MAG: hypothetical protein DRN27_09370 [Thermoplasmata archaeon]|nr:MAG: hypothetical protein DRN27_09370 [Thermoplasmata archaeon]
MIMNQKKFIKIGAIIIVALLISVSIYYIFINQPEQIIAEEKEIIIDDQICPYRNQGLTVQTLRIRHRGLLDRMNTGLINDKSWDDPPEFYYTLLVDDNVETIARSIGEDGESFKRWDTIGMECRDKFYVQENQSVSYVVISIVEVTKKGLFNRQSINTVKETINLVFDFRTGRWSGDDYFMDEDGYGHYLGETFEVWFNIYSSDFDNDGIPYWTEVNVLGTDPTVDDTRLDPDNDGIPTAWEWKWNYDPFTWNDHENLDPDIDGIQNIEEYAISKWWSNPYQPDIYIEVDFMEKKNKWKYFDHVLHEEPKQMVIERYAQHGIWTYFDDGWADGPVNGGGEMLPYLEEMSDQSSGFPFGRYEHHFPDERKGVFRYIHLANIGGFVTPFHDNMMDCINIGTGLEQSLLYCKGYIWNERLRQHGIASGIFHELGHTLGFSPAEYNGVDLDEPNRDIKRPSLTDDEYYGYIENYNSVMNYDKIYKDKTLFDYSHGENGQYDRDDWACVYVASFERNGPSYEEPEEIDPSFEDFEVIDKYPGVLLNGWQQLEKLTNENLKLLSDQIQAYNTDCDIQLFLETENQSNIRVYAKPNVAPVYSEYSLIAEGIMDNEKNIKFYDIDDKIRELYMLI